MHVIMNMGVVRQAIDVILRAAYPFRQEPYLGRKWQAFIALTLTLRMS